MLTPKNWKSFQHYKDRAPLWIKLHRGLLDNIDYHLLTPLAGKSLPLIWLIASEKDGILPDADEIAFRLRISAPEAADVLDQLTRRGFLIETNISEPAEQGATLAQTIAANNGFGSRHIPDAIKRMAWERDQGKCKKCGSVENIEYDHVHPVSKGGNSELDNIQLLCRPCNRSKRVSIATRAQQPSDDSRSLEKENIDKRERETEKNGAVAPPDPSIPERDYFLRGREVLGKGAGGLIGKLLKAKGGNVALARSAIEQASQKQNPTEYIAAICRGPPAIKPNTAHQQERQTGREILDGIGEFISGSGSEADTGILRYDPGDGPESLRGRAGRNLIELSATGSRSRE
jgi:hypothetical protein